MIPFEMQQQWRAEAIIRDWLESAKASETKDSAVAALRKVGAPHVLNAFSHIIGEYIKNIDTRQIIVAMNCSSGDSASQTIQAVSGEPFPKIRKQRNVKHQFSELLTITRDVSVAVESVLQAKRLAIISIFERMLTLANLTPFLPPDALNQLGEYPVELVSRVFAELIIRNSESTIYFPREPKLVNSELHNSVLNAIAIGDVEAVARIIPAPGQEQLREALRDLVASEQLNQVGPEYPQDKLRSYMLDGAAIARSGWPYSQFERDLAPEILALLPPIEAFGMILEKITQKCQEHGETRILPIAISACRLDDRASALIARANIPDGLENYEFRKDYVDDLALMLDIARAVDKTVEHFSYQDQKPSPEKVGRYWVDGKSGCPVGGPFDLWRMYYFQDYGIVPADTEKMYPDLSRNEINEIATLATSKPQSDPTKLVERFPSAPIAQVQMAFEYFSQWNRDAPFMPDSMQGIKKLPKHTRPLTPEEVMEGWYPQ